MLVVDKIDPKIATYTHKMLAKYNPGPLNSFIVVLYNIYIYICFNILFIVRPKNHRKNFKSSNPAKILKEIFKGLSNSLSINTTWPGKQFNFFSLYFIRRKKIKKLYFFDAHKCLLCPVCSS